MDDYISREAAYCLETGNAFDVTKLDPARQVKVEVVACKKPYMMVRYHLNDRLTANWSIGIQIKYCPVCGRKLADG